MTLRASSSERGPPCAEHHTAKSVGIRGDNGQVMGIEYNDKLQQAPNRKGTTSHSYGDTAFRRQERPEEKSTSELLVFSVWSKRGLRTYTLGLLVTTKLEVLASLQGEL